MYTLIDDIIQENLEAKKEREELNTLFGLTEGPNGVVTEGFWTKIKESFKSGLSTFKKKLSKATTKKEVDAILKEHESYIEKTFSVLKKTIADKRWLEDQLDSEDITFTMKGYTSLDELVERFKDLTKFLRETVNIEAELNKELRNSFNLYQSSTDKDFKALYKAVKEAKAKANKASISAKPSFVTFDKKLTASAPSSETTPITCSVVEAASLLSKAMDSAVFDKRDTIGIYQEDLDKDLEEEDFEAFDLVNHFRLDFMDDVIIKSDWIEDEYTELLTRFVQSILKAVPEEN